MPSTTAKAHHLCLHFDIPELDNGNRETVTRWEVTSGQDLRWQRCHIKSTSLLGNVLHMMEGVGSGAGEIILFDAEDNLTEAAACNVFVVTNGIIRTPQLDNHKLAGVTRDMAIAILRQQHIRGARRAYLTPRGDVCR